MYDPDKDHNDSPKSADSLYTIIRKAIEHSETYPVDNQENVCPAGDAGFFSELDWPIK